MRNFVFLVAIALAACGGSQPSRMVQIGDLCASSDECVQGAICGTLFFRSVGGIPIVCGCDTPPEADDRCCLPPCTAGMCR